MARPPVRFDRVPLAAVISILASFVAPRAVAAADGLDPAWQNLSSRRGELPAPPGGSHQQTGALAADLDGDGTDDFVLSFREKPPALVWYRRGATGWTTYVIEKEYLTVEAGGAAADVDGDGDLDLVFGGDWQSGDVWWWENPSPRFDPRTPWKRRLVKQGGAKQHHDQAFGDFLGTGRPQLAFWNQQAKALLLAEIPPDPRAAGPWPTTEVVSGASAGATPYTEGLSAYDVDQDGRVDILAYDSWFRHTGGKTFTRVRFADEGGLVFAGFLKASKHPQIVVSPGDGEGRVRWYECTGDPANAADWKGRDLLDRKVIHGHSLQLGDVDRDGRLDVFLGEMAKWREKETARDNPEAAALVFYGDGEGGFARREVVTGHGWHEARLVDLDGDGDLDLLDKPYNWDAPRVDVWLQNGTRAGARGAGTSASFRGPLGLQLYSLRETFARNVGLGLQTARGFGFREVELAGTYGLAPADLRGRLDRAGLRAVSMLVDYDELATGIDRVIADARALGVSYVGTAWIPHEGAFDAAAAGRAAADLDRFGARLANAGLRFVYHNHGYEFAPDGDGTLFDRLVERTDPSHVSFEMDVFWVVHPGQDPVALLKRYPGRFALLHVKDMRKGTPTGKLTGSEDVRSDVALGSGQIDLAATLEAAQAAGVSHFFIEDESPDVLSQLPRSLRWLESLAW
jgi:sugar phosphate isomerase/epimerase